MLHLPVTAMPTNEKANPAELSLLRFEAIVFLTKYLAHLLQRALGLGKLGEGFMASKLCMTKTASISKNKLSSGLRRFFINLNSQASQLIPSDTLEFQDIRPSTSRWVSLEPR